MAPTFFHSLQARGLSHGDVVLSLAGHDRGDALLVLEVAPPYASVADGALRRYAKPKRKRLRHLRPIGRIDDPDEALARVAAIRDGPAREAAIRSLLDGFFAKAQLHADPLVPKEETECPRKM